MPKLEVCWSEEKQMENKNYTRSFKKLIEGLPYPITKFTLIYLSGNTSVCEKPNNNENYIKLLDMLIEEYD